MRFEPDRRGRPPTALIVLLVGAVALLAIDWGMTMTLAEVAATIALFGLVLLLALAATVYGGRA